MIGTDPRTGHRRWVTGAGHGRTLWTGQFDSTAMGEPAASGDSVVFLDGSGTLWAVRV
ncbi:PQQ-binding-like beta-propeller repeat protein [Streptomyces sp. NPDC091387]|uniref:PQQ-binding-like beta-propeller repeat protein n=1 Tax=Streptomyces sp. NPDC091387 TaxID=3365998 RepID=UPI00381E8B46